MLLASAAVACRSERAQDLVVDGRHAVPKVPCSGHVPVRHVDVRTPDGVDAWPLVMAGLRRT